MAQPTTSRDFLKVAGQRLTVAEFLLDNTYTLDATYLAGYAIECALKALLLETTPGGDRSAMLARITRGAAMHDLEHLCGLLRNAGVTVPADLADRLIRTGWATSLRYETGSRDYGETRFVIKAAAATIKWVEGQLP